MMKYVLAVVIFFPFLITFVSYIVLKLFGLKKKQRTRLAADLTTPFLIVSIPLIFQAVWNIPFLLIFIALLMFVAIIITYKEWRKVKEINVPKLLKRIWRAYFLGGIAVYVVLLIVGILYTAVMNVI